MQARDEAMKGLVLGLVLVFGLALPQQGICQGEELDSQKELRQEIQLLNLLKGLFLSDEQKQFLIEKAKEAQQLREALLANQRRYSEDSTQTLEHLKSELVEDKYEVSEDVAREIHQTDRKRLQLKADYEKKIGQIVAEVKNNLTSTQLHIMEEFKPCLVPPKGPARFGQSEDAAGGAKRLERIRQMPDNKYAARKYELADGMLERVLLHKPKGAEVNEDEARDGILAIFEEARGLPEVEFNLKKEELAKRLAESLKTEIAPEKKTVSLDVRIERLILNPTLIPILSSGLSSGSSGTVPPN